MDKGFIVSAISLLLLSSCSSSYNASKLPRSEGRGYPLVSGHRGANCIAPENTFASVDSCIRYGIDIMETDIKVSADSVFYILHDWTLDRTTDGSGYLYERSSSYVDSLDAGKWFGAQWTGQKVPRFRDLLKRAKEGGLRITVDYKDGDIGKMVDLIREEGMLKDTYFTFYEESDVIAFRNRYPDIRTLQPYCRDPKDLDRVIKATDPDIIVCNINALDEGMIKKCHRKGIKVLALILGLEDKTELNGKVVDLKVDIVATDRPEAFRRQFDYDAKGL